MNKMSALDRLSAALAHELGNPLIGITYLLDDLSHRAALDDEDKQLIDAGLTECGRMRDLINALNDLHRPSPGIMEMLDMNTIATTVLKQYERVFKNAGIIVEMQLDAELPDIRGVKPQLSDAIKNLVVNAVEAMKRRGGTLLLQSTYRGNQVHLSIGDTGNGINPEHQEYIFEPLFSTREGSQNMGLGLTQVYRIMQSHGGHVCFRSRPAGGSTFALVVPTPFQASGPRAVG